MTTSSRRTKTLALSAALLSQALFISADVCSSVAPGDLNGCYAQVANCHYSFSTHTCTTGAPATCPDYASDLYDCLHPANTALTCTFNEQADLCQTQTQACSSETTSAACTNRAECNWTGTACAATALSAACNTYNDTATCDSNGCFWDQYASKCFVSLNQVDTTYDCSEWTNNPSAEAACQYHGCVWFQGYQMGNNGQYLPPGSPLLTAHGGTCVNTTESGILVTEGYVLTVNTGDSASSSYNLNGLIWGIPVIDANTYTFHVNVSFPLYISLIQPIQSYITFGVDGNGFSSWNQQHGFLIPGQCNDASVLAGNTFGPVPSSVYSGTVANLYTQFQNWVSVNHNYNFPNTDWGNALTQALGHVNSTSTNGVSAAYISADGKTVTQTITYDLGLLVQNCGSTGVTLTTAANGIGTYYIPITYAQLSENGGWVISSTAYDVAFQTTGSVATQATSAFPVSANIAGISTLESCCPAGQQAMIYTMQVEYSHVYATGQVVGPFVPSNVYMNNPNDAAYPNENSWNCYGDNVTDVTLVGCASTVCSWLITVQSDCVPITTDGQAFNNCPTGSITTIDPTGASLSGVHDMWITPNVCPSSTYGSGCFNFTNTSPSSADGIYSNLLLDVFPSQTVSASYAVEAGLLPRPQDGDINDLLVLGVANGPYNGTGIDAAGTTPFDYNLENSGTLSVLIAMANSVLMDTTPLYIIPSQVTIQALDFAGNPTAQAPIAFTSIENELTYCSKTVRVQNIQCQLLNIVQQYTGTDGFAISVPALTAALPAQGYAITLGYQFILPTSNSNTAQVNQVVAPHHSYSDRHLLQVRPSKVITSAVPTSGVYNVKIGIKDTVTTVSGSNGTTTTDSSNYSPTVIGLAVALSVVGALFILWIVWRCCIRSAYVRLSGKEIDIE